MFVIFVLTLHAFILATPLFLTPPSLVLLDAQKRKPKILNGLPKYRKILELG